MKKKGSNFEERHALDNELLNTFYQLLKLHPTSPIRELMKKLVNHPASRFWVSEERARVVVADLLRGKTPHGMRPDRLEMFQEIKRRALSILAANKCRSLFSAVREAVRQPAPRFYLTPGSAKVLLCRARKRRRDERGSKTHLG